MAYALWAALQNGNYYAAPYLSPFYSPCLAASCAHVSVPLVGAGWTLSPALLVLWIPGGFRATCYYYRKAYYRSLFRSPAACAVPDAAQNYSGETRFPLVLQNLHRYFFYLTLPVLAFLWWDALRALPFRRRLGRRGGHAGSLRECGIAQPVLPFVQLVPPCVRRIPRFVSRRAAQVPRMEVREPPERESPRVRLGEPRVGGLRRPVRPPAVDGPPPRREAVLSAAEIETLDYDVLVVGAGGAGLRAAIEAASARCAHGAGVQIPAGQGAHGHGRKRHRGGAWQRARRGHVAGPLPRHDARRGVAQRLAHGPHPRRGSARARARARRVGRGVRPNAGGADPAAGRGRPPLRAPCARRRSHRPRAGAHAAATRSEPGRGCAHGVQRAAPAHARRSHQRRVRAPPRFRRIRAVQLQGHSARNRRRADARGQ